MTGEEYLIGRLERLRGEASQLADDEYDAEEMWRFVRDAAAMFERFLQTTTLSQPPTDPKLYNLVNALEHDGVQLPAREALHAVRTTANDGKHDASLETSYRRVEELLVGAEDAVREIGRAGVQELAAPYEPPYRRRFLIAVYDHLAGGESEFYIWLAGQEPRGPGLASRPEIETFQFQYRDEAAVQAALETAGDLHFGDVDPEIVQALGQDSEFTKCGYWEGSYRDLVSACAPGQHDMELLPGLARHDHEGPVAAAFAMSLVDLAQPLPAKGSRPTVDDLLAHASMHYAVKRRTKVTAQLAPAYERFVADLPDESITLRGPRFLSPDSFAAAAEGAVHVDTALGLAVLDDGTLLSEFV